ncbi:MAG: ATP-binding protein, partial [Butyricicoccaceae bacterium]
NQAVSAKELSDRILALSTTGDSAMMYSNAVEQLDKWRSQLKGGSHGRLAQVEAERGLLEEDLTHLDELDEEIRGYEQRIPQAEQAVRECEAEHQKTYEQFMVLFAGKREEAERRERKAREDAAHLKQQLPDLKKLKDAENAVAAYEQACEDLQQEQMDYEDINQNYTDYRSQIDRTEQEYDKSEWGTSDIHVRWWALVIAVVFVLAAAASFLKLLPFQGMMATVMPYAFSLLAVVFLIISYFNSSQSLEKPPMDFDQERKKLDKRKAKSGERIAQAVEKRKQAEQCVYRSAEALHIPAGDLMQIAAEVAELVALREEYIERKQLHETLSEQYLDILEATGPNGSERQRLNQAKQQLDKANAALNDLRQCIAVCQGRCKEIGTREQLEQRRQQLEDEHEDILWNLDAIEHAKQALIRVNAELTGRMAPQINQLAQKYLQTLTANKYAALQLYTNFEAVCRQENSAVELDRLRLSTGTRDQLYFALRLAACIVLLDTRMEKVPLIMDDPFLTYDEERSACAMSLLRELAYERQIILLTCRKPVS